MCSLTYELITAKTKGNSDYEKIKRLNCWASNLGDVSLLQSLPSIEVLTLSVNEITSLKSIQHCVNLSELYIRNNKIAKLDEIFYLKNLKRLKILWLADNPATGSNDYRHTVIRNLINLNKLDNITITNEEKLQALISGREINQSPSDEIKQEINEKNIAIDTTVSFSEFIQPLESQKSEQDEEDNNHDIIVTELIAANETTELAACEHNTLDFTTENSIFETIYKKHSNSRKDSNSGTSETESEKLSSTRNSSNVLPAILLLLNELNVQDLEIVVDTCLKRQNNLSQFV